MRCDTARVMREAHRDHKDALRLGLKMSFGQCLRKAWQAERQRRVFEAQQWALVLGSLRFLPGDMAL